ncbi:MAG: FHA domain-containing protein [Mariprofundales bacterium]
MKYWNINIIFYLACGILLICLFCIMPAMAENQNVLTADALEVHISQSGLIHVDADIRFYAEDDLYSAQARLGDDLQMLPSHFYNYPQIDQYTAILFMVDTSDPRRHDVVRRNADIIAKILDSSKAHHRLGLATFDRNFSLVSPIGTPINELRSALGNLQAQGQTTELYRLSLEGIDLLAQVEATRKALYVFSDGAAEDSAYNLQDVVQAANQAGITIISLGFSANVSASTRLQSLRRMSEETQGHFFSEIGNELIPENFIKHPFTAIDSGGHLQVSIDEASTMSLFGNQALQLDIYGTSGAYASLKWQVRLAPKIVESPEPTTEPNLLWLWLIAAIIILFVLFFFILRKKRIDKTYYARLEFLDGDSGILDLSDNAVRIGRNKDNDVCLRNDSISGYHAQLHRRRDGIFILTDLDSTNGVLCNNESVRTVELVNGDLIELGEVRMRFVEK